MAKKQPKENKGKIKESEKSIESEAEGDGEGAGGDDGKHDDAAQDKELITKMINEYLGDGAKKLSKEESEALHSLGKEAHAAHIEMGKKEEEAYQHAGEAVKLAHHMASKKKAGESEAEKEDDAGDEKPAPKKKAPPEPDPKDDAEGESVESEKESEEKESEKESEKKESKRVKDLKNKLLETEGRLAALEAKDRKHELDGYVDGKLKESGQPVAVTKRFREAAGKLKSKADFDSQWKVFLAGVKDANEDIDWGVMMEKSTSTEEGERKTGGDLDFSDCAE